ncbi:MAG: hypothetical protein ACPGQL_07745 [Thermoplasmatota archaeon]
MRRAVPLLLLALLLAPIQVAQAGSADDPEITDPSGDQAVVALVGPLAPGFEEIDIEAVWLDELDEQLRFHVVTNATFSGSSVLEFNFAIEEGPESVFTSTANGTAYRFAASPEAVDGVAGGNVTVDGTNVTVTVPRASLNASGGDVLADLVVTGLGFDQGPTGAVDLLGLIDADDASAADRAPDNGTGRPYTFDRAPIVADLLLEIQGDDVLVTPDGSASLSFGIRVVNAGTDEDTVTLTTPANSATSVLALAPDTLTLAPGAEAFSFLTLTLDDVAAGTTLDFPVLATSLRGATAETTASVTVRDTVASFALTHLDQRHRQTDDPDATLVYNLEIENTGTDTDTLTFDTPTVTGSADVTLEPASLTLEPGQTGTVQVTLALRDASGHVHVDLQASSLRGATLEGAVMVDVATAGGGGSGGERDPVLSSPAVLTDAAEALGFDEVFEDWAEVVLLALIVLLLLLLLFLLLFLPRRRWIAVTVEPRSLRAAPGETAEFHVRVRNRKKRQRPALARLSNAGPDWKAGILLERPGDTEAATAGGEAKLYLDRKKEEGDAYEGTVRVQVPADAEQGRHQWELDVVPLDDDGLERPRKGDSVKLKLKTLKVQAEDALAAAAALDDAYDDGPTAADRDAAPKSGVEILAVTHQPAKPLAGDLVTTSVQLVNHDATPRELRVVLARDHQSLAEGEATVDARETVTFALDWFADAGRNDVTAQVYEA